ncbi:transposase [Patescibacteria group bacterium]|nr:transposase [Patescibacteria group bacterium]
MKFEKFKPCHVIIRAVEGRTIFSDIADCSRFVFQVYANNLGKPHVNIYRKNVIYIADKLLEGEDVSWKLVTNPHSPIVDILSFAIVGDHAHFILSPNVEKGIPKYIQKINVSFARYYNMKYKREGVLFNKPYKVAPLETVSELNDTLRYINVKNALDIYNFQWKSGIENWKEAFDFVSGYKYSSYPDLFGKRKSKILAPKPIIEKYVGQQINKNRVENVDFIEKYLNKEMEYNNKIFLEE